MFEVYSNVAQWRARMTNEYYSEDEVYDAIPGRLFDEFKEYLYGWDDAIVDGTYKKVYVDMYCRKIGVAIPTTRVNHEDAIRDCIGPWLPLAEKRCDELRTKIDRTRSERTRVVMQSQYDELDAQIESVKRELDEAERRQKC